MQDKTLLPESTIYVSLEPCCFHGKTPPCTDLILKSRIPRVVIGCLDPNPKVSGEGIRRLRKAGVNVELAPDPQSFVDLNRPFFRNHLSRRPYITLKWAESADGFIAGLDEHGEARRTAISGQKAALLTHRLRALHQAILVGARTVRIDNPSLATRLYPGDSPLRLVLGKTIFLTDKMQVFQDGNPTMITSPQPGESLVEWLQKLYREEEIGSILVEGGSQTLQQFLVADLYDEIYRYRAPLVLNEGVAAPRLPLGIVWEEIRQLGEDQLFHFQRPL